MSGRILHPDDLLRALDGDVITGMAPCPFERCDCSGIRVTASDETLFLSCDGPCSHERQLAAVLDRLADRLGVEPRCAGTVHSPAADWRRASAKLDRRGRGEAGGGAS